MRLTAVAWSSYFLLLTYQHISYAQEDSAQLEPLRWNAGRSIQHLNRREARQLRTGQERRAVLEKRTGVELSDRAKTVVEDYVFALNLKQKIPGEQLRAAEDAHRNFCISTISHLAAAESAEFMAAWREYGSRVQRIVHQRPLDHGRLQELLHERRQRRPGRRHSSESAPLSSPGHTPPQASPQRPPRYIQPGFTSPVLMQSPPPSHSRSESSHGNGEEQLSAGPDSARSALSPYLARMGFSRLRVTPRPPEAESPARSARGSARQSPRWSDGETPGTPRTLWRSRDE